MTSSTDNYNKLERIELLEHLGFGTFGNVYHGKERLAAGGQRDVAVKILKPELVQHSRFTKMLQAEELAASIGHPNGFVLR